MSDKTYVAEHAKSKIYDDSHASDSSEIVFDKVVIRSFIAFTGLIGLWVIACLASAMYHSGGPLQLITSWFKAVTGV